MKSLNYIALEKLASDCQITLRHDREVTLAELAAVKTAWLSAVKLQDLEQPELMSRETYKAELAFACAYQAVTGVTPEAGYLTDPLAAKRLWQFVNFALKIPLPSTEEQEKALIKRFIENNSSCKGWKPGNARAIRVIEVARKMILEMLSTPEGQWFLHDIDNPERMARRMRHGPGSVYDGERNEGKEEISEITESLARECPEDVFGSRVDWCVPDNSFQYEYRMRLPVSSRLRRKPGMSRSTGTMVPRRRGAFVTELARCYNIARFTAVPKDWKGPRGVFVQTKECMMYQLAFADALSDLFSSTVIGESWITETSQERSRAAAYSGSLDEKLAVGFADGTFTMDLTDASDRIPLALIAQLFPRRVYLALARARPHYIRLPNGKLEKMHMFAPMGEGRTFAVLSIVMATLALATAVDDEQIASAGANVSGYGLQSKTTMSLAARHVSRIAVTGDDLAGPLYLFKSIRETLEGANLRVSEEKSFEKGPFRESCGCDAMRGVIITPFRLKVDLHDESEKALMQIIDLHNRMALSKEYPRTVRFLRSLVLERDNRVAIISRANEACALYDESALEIEAELRSYQSTIYRGGSYRIGVVDLGTYWSPNEQLERDRDEYPIYADGCGRPNKVVRRLCGKDQEYAWDEDYQSYFVRGLVTRGDVHYTPDSWKGLSFSAYLRAKPIEAKWADLKRRPVKGSLDWERLLCACLIAMHEATSTIDVVSNDEIKCQSLIRCSVSRHTYDRWERLASGKDDAYRLTVGGRILI